VAACCSTPGRQCIGQTGGAENAGLENAGPENAGLENRLESDELRLKQPQTSTTIDVSELSQNCVGLFRGVVCGGSKEAIAPSKK